MARAYHLETRTEMFLGQPFEYVVTIYDDPIIQPCPQAPSSDGLRYFGPEPRPAAPAAPKPPTRFRTVRPTLAMYLAAFYAATPKPSLAIYGTPVTRTIVSHYPSGRVFA